MLALGLWACGDTETSDGRSGGVDLETHCRAWCEPETGCAELGQVTPVQCLADCVGNAERDPCFSHVVTYQQCMLAMECVDPFEDCEEPVNSGQPRGGVLVCEGIDNAYALCTCENLLDNGTGGTGGTSGEPLSANWVYCDNLGVAAPSCSLAGYSMADDSELRLKLEGCASSTCHGVGALSANTWALDLSVSVEAGLSALNHFADGSPFFLVDDLDPDCSQMLADVSLRPVGPVRMPVTGGFWSTDEVDCFRSYLHEMSN